MLLIGIVGVAVFSSDRDASALTTPGNVAFALKRFGLGVSKLDLFFFDVLFLRNGSIFSRSAI